MQCWETPEKSMTGEGSRGPQDLAAGSCGRGTDTTSVSSVVAGTSRPQCGEMSPALSPNMGLSSDCHLLLTRPSVGCKDASFLGVSVLLGFKHELLNG